MTELAFFRINITGVVQSVGFRPFIQKLAAKLEIMGYVRNLASAGVEIVIKSTNNEVDEFVNRIKEDKPELAIILKSNVIEVDSDEIDPGYLEGQFKIIPSKKDKEDKSGFSALPPDVAICDDCIEDMGSDPRLNYSFTSCTNCGPRYTAIYELPYDRPQTAFRDFPLCETCNAEYTDISDRRLHAQTTCCTECGPIFTMYEKNEDSWESRSSFKWEEVNNGLARGEIFVIMGIGGSHIVSDALNTDKIQFLRENKRKKTDKPFAVMMQNIETIRKYCITTKKDEKLLTSVRRPILILPIREDFMDEFEFISPGLLTLGVMLPYTGMHYNLFDKKLKASTEVLLMTSANELGVPMPITQETITADSSIFQFADKIMIHNRKIAQRVDDSVIRSHGDNHLLIRRSRGYVPQPLYLQSLENHGDMISLGAEENNTGAIMKNGWVVPSQHIGHIQNYECLSFLQSSLDHLVDLFNLDPKYLILDLHPDFLNRKLIPNYLDLKTIEVQHHLAHVASLALDNNMEHSEPIMAWALDGYGYGTDGQAWGGELIYLNNGDWNRVASTSSLGYDGADVNAKYPGRMLLKYMIAGDLPVREVFTDDKLAYYFKHASREFDVINRSTENRLTTTSVARLLDSVSALLKVSNIRSYRGEPAIKLEDMALRYNHRIKFDDDYLDSFIVNDSMPKIDTITIFSEIYENYKNNTSPIKIAYLTHELLGSSMARLGMILAEDFDLNKLGLTGGVAFNKLITQSMQNYLKDNDLELLLHNHISPGDAGISAGQLNYAGMVMDKQ